MSGGTFDYKQYSLREIWQSIQLRLRRQGKERPASDLIYGADHYKEYPHEKYYESYSKDVQAVFQEGIQALKIAKIYAHRIDWFLAGDDDEDSLIEQLAEDLKKVQE